MKYNKPFDATADDAQYINGDPSVGRRGSIPPAEAIEYPQREIVNVIVASGQTPTNTDMFQLLKAIRFFGSDIKRGVDTGTKNAIVVDLSPAPTTYDRLFCLVQKMATDNDDVMTFTANGMGTKSLKDLTGAPLSSAALAGGGVYLFMYDGSQMRVLGGTTSYSTISGLTASGGEVIDVTTGGVISVNFDKPAHNAAFDVDDILVRKLKGGGSHVKFTVGEFMTWIAGHITFPPADDPMYLDTDGHYKIRTATTTARGVARKATGAEVLARVAVADKPYVGPEDLPSLDPWGLDIGAIAQPSGYYLEDNLTTAPLIGKILTADELRSGKLLPDCAVQIASCALPTAAFNPGEIGSGAWCDVRRADFTGRWKVISHTLSSIKPSDPYNGKMRTFVMTVRRFE